ncbi:MAG: hypothetical protein OXC48_05800 [Endozoicomonadaceae bacterium]|nr:hypothetical protein [Endozoicomonadaceae bacterium]
MKKYLQLRMIIMVALVLIVSAISSINSKGTDQCLHDIDVFMARGGSVEVPLKNCDHIVFNSFSIESTGGKCDFNFDHIMKLHPGHVGRITVTSCDRNVENWTLSMRMMYGFYTGEATFYHLRLHIIWFSFQSQRINNGILKVSNADDDAVSINLNYKGPARDDFKLQKSTNANQVVTSSCFGKTHLNENEACQINIDNSRKQIGSNIDLIAQLTGLHGSKTEITIQLKVPMFVLEKGGHFIFEDSNGKSITNLNLKPGDSGTVILRNVGKSDITFVNLMNGLTMVNFGSFQGTCFPENTYVRLDLKSKDSCTFEYRITDDYPDNHFMLTATGVGADNSGTNSLTVNISTRGHFVFRNTEGKNLSALNLKPGDKGTILLHNTGKVDITGLHLIPKFSTVNIFQNTSTCIGVNELNFGRNCTIDYTIPANPTSANISLIARGTNADNSQTVNLPLHVSAKGKGHLVFRNINGNAISSLNINDGDAGMILLQNTGDTDITNLSLSGLPTGITDAGSCFPKLPATTINLPSGNSCTIAYPFIGTLSDSSITLTANGTVADNGGETLTINITPRDKGHFVFRDSEGNNINKLNLQANASGRFELYNTGSTIFGFSLSALPAGIQSTGTCSYTKMLLSKKSCTVDYKVPQSYSPPASGTQITKASSTDSAAVDNDGAALTMQ